MTYNLIVLIAFLIVLAGSTLSTLTRDSLDAFWHFSFGMVTAMTVVIFLTRVLLRGGRRKRT